MKAFIAVSAVIALINSALLFASPSYASEFLNITGSHASGFHSDYSKNDLDKIKGFTTPSEKDLKRLDPFGGSGQYDTTNLNDLLISPAPASCSDGNPYLFHEAHSERMRNYENQMNRYKETYYPGYKDDASNDFFDDKDIKREPSPLIEEAKNADLCDPDSSKTEECVDLIGKSLSDPMQAMYGVEKTLGQTIVDFDIYKKTREPLLNKDDDRDIPDNLDDMRIRSILDGNGTDEDKAKQIDELFDTTHDDLDVYAVSNDDEIKYRKKLTEELIATIDFKMAQGKSVDKELSVLSSVNPSAAAAIGCFLSNSKSLKKVYKDDGTSLRPAAPNGKLVGPISGVVYADELDTHSSSKLGLYAAVLIFSAALVKAISDTLNRKHEAEEGTKNRTSQDRATDALLKTTRENNLTQIYLDCKRSGDTGCKDPYKDNTNKNPGNNSQNTNSNPPKTTKDPDKVDFGVAEFPRLPPNSNPKIIDSNGSDIVLPEDEYSAPQFRLDPDRSYSSRSDDNCLKEIRNQSVTTEIPDDTKTIVTRINKRVSQFKTSDYRKQLLVKQAKITSQCLDRDYKNE